MSAGDVLRARGSVYGQFTDCAHVAQRLKGVAAQSPGWARMSDVQRESLELVFTKLSRMLAGDPEYLDNLVDIIGYTQLIINYLEEPDEVTAKSVVEQESRAS